MRAGNIEIRDATATEVYLETYIPVCTVGPSSSAFGSRTRTSPSAIFASSSICTATSSLSRSRER